MDPNDWKNGMIWSTILAGLAAVQDNKPWELFYFQKCFYFLLSWKNEPPKLHSSLTHSQSFQIEIVTRNIIKMIEHHINKRWRLKTKGNNFFHYLEWDWKAAFHPFWKQSIFAVPFSIFTQPKKSLAIFSPKPLKTGS